MKLFIPHLISHRQRALHYHREHHFTERERERGKGKSFFFLRVPEKGQNEKQRTKVYIQAQALKFSIYSLFLLNGQH